MLFAQQGSLFPLPLSRGQVFFQGLISPCHCTTTVPHCDSDRPQVGGGRRKNRFHHFLQLAKPLLHILSRGFSSSQCGTQAAVDLLHSGQMWDGTYQSERWQQVSICLSLMRSVKKTFVFTSRELSFIYFAKFSFKKKCLFWERDGETESQAHSTLPAQSLMWGSNSQTLTSWPEPKARTRCLTDWVTQVPIFCPIFYWKEKVYIMVKRVLFLNMNVKTFSQLAISFDFLYAVLFACVFVLSCFVWQCRSFPFLIGEFYQGFFFFTT